MRGKVIGLGIAALIVVGLWAAGWFWASGELRAQIVALAANDGETAPQLSCGQLDIGGFPFGFDVTCTNASLVDGDETITAGGLKASALVYNPTHVVFSAASPVSTDNAFTGSRSRVDFEGLEGSARVTPRDWLKGFSGEGWRIARISVVADGVRWFDTITTDLLQASADHLEAHLVDVPEEHDAKAGTATLAAFAMVRKLAAPGYGVAAADGDAEIHIAGLPDDLRAFADPEPLRSWQARGGHVDIVKLTGTQAEPKTLFDVTGKATLTGAGLLDTKLDYRTQNIFERFATAIPPWQMPLLEGAQQPDGSYRNTLTMQDGELKLLTFTLLSLGPLF